MTERIYESLNRATSLLEENHDLQKQVQHFMKEKSFWSVSDTLISKDDDAYKYVLKPSRDFYKVQFTNNLPELTGQFPLYNFKDKQIFIINKQ